MKSAAIAIAALGIALIVTMGPAPASAQTTVIRDCGDHYVVTRYNQDGSVKGVHKKQLSDEGTIYTAGKTWKLVEGNPDRFVSDGGVQLQVIACDAALGAGTRDVQQQGAQIQSSHLVSNTGQTTGAAAANITIDRAQAFTTGSNSAGYTLTSVQLSLQEVGSQTITFIVTLHEDSSGTPSTTSLGTLTTTTTTLPGTFGLVQYNASGNGISLDANKTYWVLIDAAGANGNHTQTQTTTSGDEDSGGAAGWSIASDHLGRGSTATDWSASATVSSVIHIRINGSAGLDRLSQAPRDPIYVTYDGQQYEAKAFSAERGTLWDYFESECTRLRSVSDPYRDYSLRDADGRLIQARNGWKYVYVQNSQGDITGTRAMTISECTSNKLYQRQQFCEVYADRQGPNEQKICPTYRTW